MFRLNSNRPGLFLPDSYRRASGHRGSCRRGSCRRGSCLTNHTITVSLLFTVFLFSCKGENAGKPTSNGIYSHPAIAPLTEQITKDSTNARAWYFRGDALHRLQEDSLALNDYKTAIAKDSTKAEYWSAVGELLFEHKDISGSVPYLQRAVQLNPADPRAHLKIAKLFLYTQEYPKAFAEINTVLRQDPFNAEGYYLKGMIYKDLKDTAKAISSFQTTINVAPTDPRSREAQLQLGLIYTGKNSPMALQYFDAAFKADTTDVFPIYARGMYFQGREEWEAAKEEYKRCILYDREYADAFFNTGFILMQQDSLEKARRQFDLVTKADPANAAAYYNRGLCSEMMGQKDEAARDYREALNFRKDYAEAKTALGRVGG